MLGKMFSREDAGSGRRYRMRKQESEHVLKGERRSGMRKQVQEDVQEGGSWFRKTFSNEEAGSGRRSRKPAHPRPQLSSSCCPSICLRLFVSASQVSFSN